MQDFPLSLSHVFTRAEQLWGNKAITTASATDVHHGTYANWAERTRKLGGALNELGVSGDARVGTFAWNSGRHLELYFAVPCTGRVLHTLNIRLFPKQLSYIVGHAEDEVMFVDRSLIGSFWPLAEKFETVRHFVVMDDGKGDVPDDPRIVDYEELLNAAPAAEFELLDEQRAAAMCYSSGTTGNPKGVVYTHRSIVLHSLVISTTSALGLTESDVVMPVVPMFHVNAWGLPYGSVLVGAGLVFPGPNMTPDALVGLIERERVTVAAGVPTIWMGVLQALDGHDVSSLRTIPCGGAAVSRALSEGYRAKAGKPLQHAWGMTETSPVGSVCNIKSEFWAKPEEELADLRVSQGLPVPLVEVRVADAGTGEVLPWDGSSFGELQVRGPFVAAGYYNDERSADSVTDDGWFRTGDVATIDTDGYIRIVDRTKDLVKSGGEWISTVDIENELMAHPAVAEAAVIAVAHSKWQERPLACVVVKEGESLDAGAVLEFLEGKVAKWWLPDDVVFIDEIPKSSTGKFSKMELRERFADHKLPSDA
jgi:fatty-acyl-CoA synthase